MSQIERYIFRIALGAFLACLIGLTGTIWVTQALRELDLVTAKGQTLLVFLFITGLSLPTLITVIAPVALFIACVYALNKLNGDSELIVMSAAGMAPRRILRPFLTLALTVSIVTAFLTIQVMPSSFQELRDVLTRVRGDFVANVVKEGQFTALDSGITFHFRERGPDGSLQGLFIQDKRDPGKAVVYLAERGRVAEADGQTYLVLEKGSIHRQQKDSRDSSIVSYERYAPSIWPPSRRRTRRWSTSRASARPRPCSSPTIRRPITSRRRAASAPSCTTGCPRGSIRWPSPSSRLPRSAIRAPRARGAGSRWRGR